MTHLAKGIFDTLEVYVNSSEFIIMPVIKEKPLKYNSGSLGPNLRNC